MSNFEDRELDAAEEAAVGALVEKRAGTRASLSDIVEPWASCVYDVRDGNLLSLDEYRNDLWSRENVQEILGRAPASLVASIGPAIRELDAIYLASTSPSDRPFPSGEVPPAFWWRYRVPKRIPPLIRDELEGFL